MSILAALYITSVLLTTYFPYPEPELNDSFMEQKVQTLHTLIYTGVFLLGISYIYGRFIFSSSTLLIYYLGNGKYFVDEATRYV